MKAPPTTEYEEYYWQRGELVAGVDEAGRGCLAGPVVAAAVILPIHCNLTGIHDSKQLSPVERAAMESEILRNCIAYAVWANDARHIERHNILESSIQAMKRALRELEPEPVHALIDGNRFHDDDFAYTTIIKGDSKCLSIAAASILAKVHRDRWMIDEAHTRYPEYGFEQHKGYGTKRHREALVRLGPCPLHRKTFLSKILA